MWRVRKRTVTLFVGYIALIALMFGGMWLVVSNSKPKLTYREIAEANREHWQDWMKPGLEVDPSTQTYTLPDGNVIALKWWGSFEPGDQWRFYRPQLKSVEIAALDAEGLDLNKLKNEAPEPHFPGVMFHLQQTTSTSIVQIARAKLFDDLSLADIGGLYDADYDGSHYSLFDWFKPVDRYEPDGMGSKTFVFPATWYGGSLRLVIDVVHGPELKTKALFGEKGAICKSPALELKFSAPSKSVNKKGKRQVIYVVNTKPGTPLALDLPASGRPFSARLIYPKDPPVIIKSKLRQATYILPLDAPTQDATEVNLAYPNKVTRLIFRIPIPARGPVVNPDTNVFDLPIEQSRFESSSTAIRFMKLAAHIDIDLGGQSGSSIEGGTVGQLYKNWIAHEIQNTTPQIQIRFDRKSRKVTRRYVRPWSDHWRVWKAKMMRWIPW